MPGPVRRFIKKNPAKAFASRKNRTARAFRYIVRGSRGAWAVFARRIKSRTPKRR